MKLPVLPVYYYHDHFLEILAFVDKTYGSILTEQHRTFVDQFHGLSKDAQCLLIRMVNRRGAIFNRLAFKYEEISDLQQALGDLMECEHARYVDEDDYVAFVACLPKGLLLRGAKAAGFTDVRASWAKPKLAAYFLASIPFSTAFEFCKGDRF